MLFLTRRLSNLLSAVGTILLTLSLAAVAATPSHAASGVTTAASTPAVTTLPANLSAAQSQQLIDLLQDPSRRQALITTLEALQKVAPPASTAAVAPAAETPAAAPAGKAKESSLPLKHDSLGADIIKQGSSVVADSGIVVVRTAREVADVSAIGQWAFRASRDGTTIAVAARTGPALLVILAICAGLDFLATRLIIPFYRSLGQERPAEVTSPEETPPDPDPRPSFRHRPGWLLLQRLPLILFAALLTLIGPAVAYGIAMVLIATPLVPTDECAALVLVLAGIYLKGRLVFCAGLAMIASPVTRLRLIHCSDDSARFTRRWLFRLLTMLVLGFGFAHYALYLGMPPRLQTGIVHLLTLVAHLIVVWAIIERRRPVAEWIAGMGNPDSAWGRMRKRYAPFWFAHAIVLVLGLWVVLSTSELEGAASPVHFVIVTIGVLLISRILSIVVLGGVDRLLPAALPEEGHGVLLLRAAHYHRPVRVAAETAVIVFSLLLLLQAWGADVYGWLLHNPLGSRLVGSLLSIFVTLIAVIAIWEAATLGIENYVIRLDRDGAIMRAARLRTIVPLIRNGLLILLVVVIVLTVLGQIGVNITPLLAGAGIFGVAIGFGSQKLVQDFITGIFLLIENAMQVGDTVTAGGLSGTVEHLSIRTLRLRAGDGSVHLIPFSAVSTVTNSNRGLGNAAVSVTVDYDEDTDRVGEILKKIALDMRAEDAFAHGMLSDLQLWGVNAVDGMTATLAGQIVCTDGARWAVQREYNRRVKIAFQAEGIRMLPGVTVTGFRHPLDLRMEQRPAAVAAPEPAGPPLPPPPGDAAPAT